MAIRTMTGAENAGLPNVETVLHYPGHDVDYVWHHWKCPHKSESSKERFDDCHADCKHHEPMYMRTTFIGCVLDTYERNGYDDSDFYAIVWNDEKGCVEHIEYATTRGWTYPNGASVDATPEVIAKALAWKRAMMLEKWKEDNQKQAKMPYKGRKVKVIAGRKIALGVVAEVFWFGDDSFKKARGRRYANPMASALGLNKFKTDDKRVGLRWLEDGKERKEFTAADNVEVLESSLYLESETEGANTIAQAAVYWRSY